MIQEALTVTEQRDCKNHGSLAAEYGARSSKQNQPPNPHQQNCSHRLMAEPSLTVFIFDGSCSNLGSNFHLLMNLNLMVELTL